MTPSQAETLSAFFDGESVDSHLLAASLQEPDAVQFLLECARLRRAVREDDSRPTEEFAERLRGVVAHGDIRRIWRHRVVQVSMAASLALAAAAGGFGVRTWMDRRSTTRAVAPVLHASQPQPCVAGSQVLSAPATTPPRRPQPDPRQVPSPGLRMHFDEWRNTAL